MTDDEQQNTQTEDGSLDSEFVPPRAWLIYVGSAENGFLDAGTAFSLDEVSKVRFGRAVERDALEQEVTDGVSYIGVPVGWVSGVHCELRIAHRTMTHDFDLQDLQSRNGTFIEGEAISNVTRVPSGAIFEVGRTFWLVHSTVAPKLDGPTVAPLALETASPFLQHTSASLGRLAPSAVPLLLSGETGTGKEQLARLIHEASGRSGEFVRAHLGAFSGPRLESLLFGDMETGGRLLDKARRGTLFLENVGELSDDAQAKLLSAVTDEAPGHDIRLICSTVHDLRTLATAGKFRGDLYSRLSGFEVSVPPLRERREDLGLLVARLARSAEDKTLSVTTPAFRRILSSPWPFNLRQLAQTLTAATILAGDTGSITRELLDEVLGSADGALESPEQVRQLREQLIRELTDHGGDIAAVAEAMGRDRQEIDQWCKRFDLSPRAYRH